jgi:hypothetical protein
MTLITEYEEKFGYDPMMEFEYSVGTQSVLDLLREANGKEIVIDFDEERPDYAKLKIE